MLDQSVDVFFTVTEVTTLDEVVELSLVETAVGVRQLEGPQEVVGLLEVGADGDDFVDQVFHRGDAELTQVGFNDGVVRQSNSLLVDLTETSLVDQLSHGGVVGVTVSHVRFDQLEQFGGGLGDSHEGTGVDLGQSQQLHDLSGLRGDLHDTLDSDDEHQLVLGFDIVVTVSLSLSLGVNESSFGFVVFLLVLSGSVGNSLSLRLVSLFG